VLRWRCRPPLGEGAGYRPAHVRNGLAPHAGRDTQDEARAALHGVRIPQARRVRSASRRAVHIARLTCGRSPATLAVDKCLQADIPSVRLGISGVTAPLAASQRLRNITSGASLGRRLLRVRDLNLSRVRAECSATTGLATAILTTGNSVMISMGQKCRKCQNGR
jgi:hypothetical protein